MGWCGVDLDGVDDFISVGTNNDLNITSNTLTIAAWVNFDSLDGGTFDRQQIFFRSNGLASGTRRGYEFQIIANGNLMFRVGVGFNDTREVRENATFPTGQWVHVAGVLDGSNPMKLYTNGTEVSSYSTQDNSASITSDSGRNARIGVGSFVDGKISDLAIWEATLTSAEILLLASSKIKRMPLQIQSINLKGYWALDDVDDGSSGDGRTFINSANVGLHDGTGNDGANNTGLVGVDEKVLSY